MKPNLVFMSTQLSWDILTSSHPELAFISPSQLRIRAVAAYMGDVEQNGQMDELRIGTSYPIVAPDESVDIILPPTADFTITPESGIAPLPVQVDAGASSDPNGSMLEYSWNWGMEAHLARELHQIIPMEWMSSVWSMLLFPLPIHMA
jgi:hypothetical protein